MPVPETPASAIVPAMNDSTTREEARSGEPTGSDTFATLVERTRGVQPWRRVFHASNGLLIGLAPSLLGFSRELTLGLLGGALVVAVSLDLLRLRNPALNERFFRSLRFLVSPREAGQVASSTWYLVGAILAYLVFPWPYAGSAMVVLGVADPAASVVGRIWGTIPLGKGSVQGTLVFTAVAWAALTLLLGNPLAMLGVAAAVAAAEILPGLVDDNLVVPLTTGAMLWLVLGTPAAGMPFPF